MTTFIELYNTLANNKTLTNGHVFLRCVIKALYAKSEDKLGVAQALISRAFTPPSKPSKVANGALNYWGFHHARLSAMRIVRTFEFSDEERVAINGLIGQLKAPK